MDALHLLLENNAKRKTKPKYTYRKIGEYKPPNAANKAAPTPILYAKRIDYSRYPTHKLRALRKERGVGKRW